VTERRKIVVFGGAGFLGRRAVQCLLDHDFAVRVASRHPERSQAIFRSATSELEFVRADVTDDASIGTAVAGTFGVVNAVSLYVERGARTFYSVHVEAASRVARHSREANVARLVHVSGIGADIASPSRYIRSRGQGEYAVRAAFPTATITRPAVMFGPDDTFLNPLIRLLRKYPFFPLFGTGRTALQPAYVEDVGEAIARALVLSEVEAVYELGGPDIYTYENLLHTISARLDLRPVLVPMPFAVWQALALLAENLDHPPITRNQVELMKIDNIVASSLPGFAALGIQPHGIETLLATKGK
jgi:uncharacterized protein YbjT (DUF2867 family)